MALPSIVDLAEEHGAADFDRSTSAVCRCSPLISASLKTSPAWKRDQCAIASARIWSARTDPRELVFGRAGYTFINAAFTHTRPGGSFNGEDRSPWYRAFEVETSLGEVAFHLTRELEAIGRFDNVTDYAELLADFFGPFHDPTRRRRAAEPPCARNRVWRIRLVKRLPDI